MTERAASDIDEAMTFIGQDSPQAATKCQVGLWSVIFSRDEMPTRYAVVAEVDRLKIPYLSVLYHSHRVIFRIDAASDTLYVVRAYHGSRQPLTRYDL